MLRDNEKWVPGLEGKYAADTYGNIISYIKKRIVLVGGILHDRKRNYKTYRIFTYKVSGKSKLEYFHRCVANAFLDNPENKPYVNHIDGNKLNNRLSNLEWATASENAQHAWDTGLMQSARDRFDNYCPFIEKDLQREEVIDSFLLDGITHPRLTRETIEKYITSDDFIRNNIPVEMWGVKLKKASYYQEWVFRFCVLSMIENYRFSLLELSTKTGLDQTQISRIKNKELWSEVWCLYDKYEFSKYNPLI